MGYDNEVSNKVEKFLFEKEKNFKFKKSGELISERLEDDYKMNLILYTKSWIDKGYTPIFEFVSLSNLIILSYEETKLIPLGIRHNLSGEYISYDELKKSCQEFNIECVKSHDLGDDIEKAIEIISGMKNIEGFVLRMKNDDLFKIKSDWYRKLHDATNKFQVGKISETELWLKILDNEMDDILSVLSKDEETKKLIETFSENLWKKIMKEFEHLTEILKTVPNSNSEQNLQKFFKYHELNQIEIDICKEILKKNEEDSMTSFIFVLRNILKLKKNVPEEVKEIINLDGSKVLSRLKTSEKNSTISDFKMGEDTKEKKKNSKKK
jgi:T4 RnlA family RNA ligase